MGSFNPHRPRTMKIVFTSSHGAKEFVRALSFSNMRNVIAQVMGPEYRHIFARPSFESPEDRDRYEARVRSGNVWRKAPMGEPKNPPRSDAFDTAPSISRESVVSVQAEQSQLDETIPMYEEEQVPGASTLHCVSTGLQATPNRAQIGSKRTGVRTPNSNKRVGSKKKKNKNIVNRNGTSRADIFRNPNRDLGVVVTTGPAHGNSKSHAAGASSPQNSRTEATPGVT